MSYNTQYLIPSYAHYTKYNSNQGNMRQRKARIAEGKKNMEPLLDAIRKHISKMEVSLESSPY
jgi:hypothetical protein